MFQLEIGTLFGPTLEGIFENLRLEPFGLANVEIKRWLWDNFYMDYRLLRSKSEWSPEDINDFRMRGYEWVEKFLTVYPASDVTPYIHIYGAHLWQCIDIHGALYHFSQEAAEQFNSRTTSVFMRQTNHRRSGESAAMGQLMSHHMREVYLRRRALKTLRKNRKS